MMSVKSGVVFIVVAVFLAIFDVKVVTGQNNTTIAEPNVTTNGSGNSSYSTISTQTILSENSSVSTMHESTVTSPTETALPTGTESNQTNSTTDHLTTTSFTQLSTTISPEPSISTTTLAPSTTSINNSNKDQPSPSGFDGASFVGGIVLALGLIVIIVIAVKCYAHHSRKNELQYSQF